MIQIKATINTSWFSTTTYTYIYNYLIQVNYISKKKKKKQKTRGCDNVNNHSYILYTLSSIEYTFTWT